MKKLAPLGASILVAFGALAFAAPAFADTVGPIDFESPAYTLGNIDGQNGWSKTGAYDSAVSSSGGTAGFGAQSLRISNGYADGAFGGQTFAPLLSSGAGETSVAPNQHFVAQFDIASVLPTLQSGLAVSVSPDDGHGSRMSYLRFEDQSDGIHVFFDDVTDAGPLGTTATFNESDIATITRAPHTIKFDMDFVDGPANDVVKIYIDGSLVHTGTSWEDYYRYDPEQAGNGNQLFPVKTLIFAARGSSVPANLGNGYLIDNLSMSSGPIPQDCSAVGNSVVSDASTQYNGGNSTVLTSGMLNPGILPPGVWVDIPGSSWIWGSDGSGDNTTLAYSETFTRAFNIAGPVSAGAVDLAADNGFSLVVNGTTVDTKNSDPADEHNYSAAAHYDLTGLLHPGSNTLEITVTNFGRAGTTFLNNPGGLIYKLSYTDNECAPPPPTSVSVHIEKFLDGALATAASANNTNFPMVTTFTSTTYGNAINAPFTLGPAGWGSDPAYMASFPNANPGADYATNEVIGSTVGSSCEAGTPYALLGYTISPTAFDTNAADITQTAPSFANLQNDEYVVVWNQTCEVAPPATLKVHIAKYLDGSPATAQSANNYIFPMTATWQTPNLNGGAQTSGTYTLGTGWGGATGYFADTAPMQAPADYVTSEVTSDLDSSSQVVPSADQCAPGKYYFNGYSSSATSFADAATQPTTTTPVQFSQISSDQYLIVWNSSCPTTGNLTVTKAAIGGDKTFNFTSDIPGYAAFSITTANHTGSMTFSNLPPGTYHVTEVNQPKGWTQTDTTCSAVDVAAGDDIECTVVDTSNKLLGSIRGTKYEDRDGDGTLKDGDHHHLAGVTIYLDQNHDGQLDNGETSTVTNTHGVYDFVGLPAGTYRVCEVVPAGWQQTYPASNGGCWNVTLSAGQNVKKENFGNFKPGSISGIKFNDLNGNHKLDTGEPGLGGWTIQLEDKHGHVLQSTVTASDGSYSFTNLPAGTYTLVEVMQNGWRQTLHPGSVTIRSSSNITNKNFGNTQKPKGRGDHDNDDHYAD